MSESETYVAACALPVPPGSSSPPEVHHRPQLHVDALSAMLATHRHSSRVDERAIPRRSRVDTGGERARVVPEAHSKRRILETDSRKVESRNGARLPHTAVQDSRAGREVDELGDGELRDERLGLDERLGPAAAGRVAHPAVVVLGRLAGDRVAGDVGRGEDERRRADAPH